MQNGNQDICNLVNDMIETWLETNYPSAFIHLIVCTLGSNYIPPPRDWQEH